MGDGPPNNHDNKDGKDRNNQNRQRQGGRQNRPIEL